MFSNEQHSTQGNTYSKQQVEAGVLAERHACRLPLRLSHSVLTHTPPQIEVLESFQEATVVVLEYLLAQQQLHNDTKYSRTLLANIGHCDSSKFTTMSS